MLFGSIGCFLAALLLGEPLYLFLKPAPPVQPEKPKVDVMFVLDATSSMQFAIDGTKTGINKFAQNLRDKDLDSQVGLIAFRDRVWEPPLLDIVFVLDTTGSMNAEISGIRDGIQTFASSLEKNGLDIQLGMVAFRCTKVNGVKSTRAYQFGTEFLTNDYSAFREMVSGLTAASGGARESSFHGLALATKQGYRKSSQRLFILITDQPPLVPDHLVSSTKQLGETLQRLGNCQLFCITNNSSKTYFEPLDSYVPVTYYNLEPDGTRVEFSYLLPKIADQTITQFKDGTIPIGETTTTAVPLIQEPQLLSFEGEQFTSSPALFADKLSDIQASGGGDIPESSLDALSMASSLSFRNDAEKVVLLITDAPPRIPDMEMQDLNEVKEQLMKGQIDQLHLITLDEFESDYSELQAAPLTGQFFSLEQAVTTSGFDQMLPEVGHEIAENTLQGLATTEAFSEDDRTKLMTLVTLWSGLLSAGICLMLVASQNMLLKNRALTLKQILQGGGGSFLTGAIAGLAGQFVFQALTPNTEAENVSVLLIWFSRVLAWGVLGTLLSLLMTVFVPNLDWRYSLLGGVLGGCTGAIGFQVLSSLTPVIGRLAGATILGGIVGMMVALSEWLSRDLCLAVQYNAYETVRVNLGKTPVTIGSAAKCLIRVAGIPELSFSLYKDDQNNMVCHDITQDTIRNVGAGHSFSAGTVAFTIEAKTKGASPNLPLVPTQPLPPPPPKKTTTRTPRTPQPKPPINPTGSAPRPSAPKPPPAQRTTTTRRTKPRRTTPKPPPPPPKKRGPGN